MIRLAEARGVQLKNFKATASKFAIEVRNKNWLDAALADLLKY